MDVPGLVVNGVFANFLSKFWYARLVLEDGVDGEVGFWEGVQVEEWLRVDEISDVRDRESR